MQILTNHLGYGANGPKKAIVQIDGESADQICRFQVIDIETGQTVLEGTPVQVGKVARWRNWIYWTIDFSTLTTPGTYRITVSGHNDLVLACSHEFGLRDRILEETISDILYYFKGQRCADQFDEKDRAVPIYGENRTVDVHGGWYDASGDVSKYLSHLSYANFMNPQHIPMVVWGMLKARNDILHKNTNGDYARQKISERLLREAMYGADFLVRMQDPCGAFYMTVFDQWTADTENRMICEYVGQDGQRRDTWQCAYRQGGGMAIAALAAAARSGLERDYTKNKYLETAITGFDHLEAHNLAYCNDGKENIIDDYCALMAATELFWTTHQARFMDAGMQRGENLLGRISKDDQYEGWLLADDGQRTFFHGADAGLPVIALLELADATPDESMKARLIEGAKRIMKFELIITGDAPNPFGYPRQYVTEPNGHKRASFFLAQNNETGYWWQGENARLASLAGAARLVARRSEGDFAAALEAYATDAINWILGQNPFDVCMLQGRGFNNATYEAGYPNAPGGICNGITAGFTDSEGIDFNPEEPHEATTGRHRWRWGEQWIPHSAWYLLATSLENND